ncbi:MAG: hypothetical protein HXY20_00630 [Acidobacteria bacterium]|nr:hypothetical protein [Acidobacteriota bacterium]
MIQDCLRTMESASGEELFAIIPRIGVLRDPRFKSVLLALLSHRDLKKREFAAYSMGAMKDPDFLEPLKEAFHGARSLPGLRSEDLLIALIEAIGAVGDDAAVDFYLELMREPLRGKQAVQMRRWIVESLGSIAQQGGRRSEAALLELTAHEDPELRARAVSELSVAYWHRPNELPEEILVRICELTRDTSRTVTESALAALQSLADVGCRLAEQLFD